MAEYIVYADIQTDEIRELLSKNEIVRCIDCKHYRPQEFVLITDIEHVCLFWADGVKVEPDGYCAWGERRSE